MVVPERCVERKTVLPERCKPATRELVVYLASNPEAGRLIRGTGGVRKIRWAIPGKGKRGGARVIYYYHNQSIPLFILDVYAKSEKADLSEEDKKAMRRIVSKIVEEHKRR